MTINLPTVRRPGLPTRSRALAVAASALLIAGCGGSGSSSDETLASDASSSTTVAADTSSTTSADTDGDVTAPAKDAAVTAAAASGEIPFGNCSSAQAATPGQVYSVSNIPANDPDGGLVARLLPGSDEQRIDVLPDGTIVDIFADDLDCVVLGDGSVWWFVNTPLLATGGYVNSRYLAGQTDMGQESDGNAAGGAAGGGEDDFDVTLAQIDCIYNGGEQSCDLLTVSGIGSPDDNYGLGNSYSMAPSGFLAEDCLISNDQLACAELQARGPGGDVASIGTKFIEAYQRGDTAAQASLSGDRNNASNGADLTVSPDPDVIIGVASASFGGNEFSWVDQPTSALRCIVEGGLVQYCSFSE
ncbi:MAG: hypothetical protein R2733_18645 [Acidimicrobiales bacterium]